MGEVIYTVNVPAQAATGIEGCRRCLQLQSQLEEVHESITMVQHMWEHRVAELESMRQLKLMNAEESWRDTHQLVRLFFASIILVEASILRTRPV